MTAKLNRAHVRIAGPQRTSEQGRTRPPNGLVLFRGIPPAPASSECISALVVRGSAASSSSMVDPAAQVALPPTAFFAHPMPSVQGVTLVRTHPFVLRLCVRQVSGTPPRRVPPTPAQIGRAHV